MVTRVPYFGAGNNVPALHMAVPTLPGVYNYVQPLIWLHKHSICMLHYTGIIGCLLAMPLSHDQSVTHALLPSPSSTVVLPFTTPAVHCSIVLPCTFHFLFSSLPQQYSGATFTTPAVHCSIVLSCKLLQQYTVVLSYFVPFLFCSCPQQYSGATFTTTAVHCSIVLFCITL